MSLRTWKLLGAKKSQPSLGFYLLSENLVAYNEKHLFSCRPPSAEIETLLVCSISSVYRMLFCLINFYDKNKKRWPPAAESKRLALNQSCCIVNCSVKCFLVSPCKYLPRDT